MFEKKKNEYSSLYTIVTQKTSFVVGDKSIMTFQEKFKSIHYHLVRTFSTEMRTEEMTLIYSFFKVLVFWFYFPCFQLLRKKNIHIN